MAESSARSTMPEETPAPYPSQKESDEMLLAAVAARPSAQLHRAPREGEDLTPAMTQVQNDVAMLIACGPPPGSQPPMVKDVPYVDGGTATVGGTLTCTMGNWTGEPTSYAYQWKRDGTADIGTSAGSYVTVAADVGHEITCVVTATNANGSTEAPPSNAIAITEAARTAPAPGSSRR